MQLPNFLIIGAAKAGTTTLYDALNQHPEAYMSPLKEPRFFTYVGQQLDPRDPVNRRTVTTWEAYTELFRGVTTEAAIGEASGYLANPSAATRIKAYLPDVKIIAILRDPVARAYSHFLFAKLQGYEPPDATFADAVKGVPVRVAGWTRERNYVKAGYYNELLDPYYGLFESSQLCCLVFDDLLDSPQSVFQKLCRFLEIDDSIQVDMAIHYAKSGTPKNRYLFDSLRSRGRLKGLVKNVVPKDMRRKLRARVLNYLIEKPEIDPAIESALRRMYRDDILKLEERLGRDLSRWRGVA